MKTLIKYILGLFLKSEKKIHRPINLTPINGDRNVAIPIFTLVVKNKTDKELFDIELFPKEAMVDNDEYSIYCPYADINQIPLVLHVEQKMINYLHIISSDENNLNKNYLNINKRWIDGRQLYIPFLIKTDETQAQRNVFESNEFKLKVNLNTSIVLKSLKPNSKMRINFYEHGRH